MSKPIKVGVVGCGYWGPNLVRNFNLLPDCQLKMMCDTSEERLQHLKSLYPEVQRARDYEFMLNGVGLDAVVIATSVKWHYPMAKASLLAGKHTFIEKPMASSSKECEELIAIAQKKGVVLMTGHTFLYSPVVRKITKRRAKARRFFVERRLACEADPAGAASVPVFSDPAAVLSSPTAEYAPLGIDPGGLILRIA